MTSKPTSQQGQQEQQGSNLLKRYATPIPATPEDGANTVNGANGANGANKPKQPPRSFIPASTPGAGPNTSNTPPSAGPIAANSKLPPIAAPNGAPRALPPLNGPNGNAGQPQPPMSMMPGQNQQMRDSQAPGGPMQRPPGPPSAQTPRPVSSSNSGVGLANRQPGPPMPAQRQQPQQSPIQQYERDGNWIILHRAANFFVRTTVKPGIQRSDPMRRPTGHTAMLPKVMPGQHQRVIESETRMMPKVDAINPLKKKQFPIPVWLEAFVVVIGLLVATVAHAYNMFGFPRYELDEGTYMENAWAILHGMISPYAYGYGHPPIAWIQIAGWVELVGGFFQFGDAVNTGRVLMLVYAIASALLTYLIVRRLGSSRSAALLAMLLFALSPIAITFGRQVLLDNVATFWFLLSFYLLVAGDSRLLYIILSGITLGISILSKEVMVLFIPFMIYAAWLHSTKFQRKFALVAFTYSVLAVGSSFVLMAVLKGELFPQGWLPGDTHPHLSLIATYLSQVQRGKSQGSFTQQWNTWFNLDPVLMVFSVATLAFNLVMGWWNRKQLLLALMAISFWLLLIRGGVVLAFYFIPLVPLVAINAAFAINTILGWLGRLARFDLLRAMLILCVVLAIIPYDLLHAVPAFTEDPTLAQQEAITWVRENVPHDAFLVINDWMFVDLRQPGGLGTGTGATYPNANIYFNVATDPAVRDTILHGQWNNIDYVIEDSEMQSDVSGDTTKFAIIDNAIKHSVVVARFTSGKLDSIDPVKIYEVIHPGTQPIVHIPSSIPTSLATIQGTQSGGRIALADKRKDFMSLT